ncbi:MAG: cupin domain-containing protein [Rubinisphaera brasiliensis]|uniref:cupin domain-containing protein n=1 Tax=Rubinisphaera brasiliensis TaxID=119 RepID=UPI00391C6E75
MKRFVIGTAISLCCVLNLSAEEPVHKMPAGGPTVKVLQSTDLEETFDGQPARVTMVEVSWKPGGVSADHRHPCPTFVYVLEGELETRVGDGPLLQLKKGDTLYEPAFALHADTRNLSENNPVRVLAIHVHPRDVKQFVIPVEQTEAE